MIGKLVYCGSADDVEAARSRETQIKRLALGES